MKNRAAAIAILTLLLFGRAAPSLAQETPPGSPPVAAAASGPAAADASARAREYFNGGVALAKKKDWRRAYEAFLEAWKLKQHPQIALNLGRAELELGKYREASEHLGYCVSHAEAGDPDAALARNWLVEVEKKVAKLVVAVDAAGAGVLVDGVLEGKAPLPGPVLVNPGEHLVQASLGERRAQSTVTIETGASLRVDLKLPEGTSLPPETPPALAPRPFPVRTAVLVGGGTASVIGLGLGATLGALALQKQAERDQCAADPEGRDCERALEAQRAALARGSFAGLLAGGLFAAGTAAYLVFGPGEPKVVVAPAVSGAGAGLLLAGRF